VHPGGAVDDSPWTRYDPYALLAEDIREAAHGVVRIRHTSCEWPTDKCRPSTLFLMDFKHLFLNLTPSIV
jgi:hypothetical protein